MITKSSSDAPSPQERRNPAEFLVLGFLAPGPAHGYDVHRHLLSEVGTVWHIGRSQLYALLARLERDGLVVHERVGQENLPAKNIFRLTDRGRDLFEQWRDSPVHNVRELRLDFLAKVFFAHRDGPECEQRLLESQIAACQERVGKLKQLRESARNLTERRAIEFRMMMAESSVKWLKATLSEIAADE